MTVNTKAAYASKARSLYQQAVVIDGLNTSRWGNETVYRTLAESGTSAINATIAIWDDYQSTLRHITDWLGWFEEFEHYIRPVHTVSDIHTAKADGRTGVIFGWQNATPIENDLRNLRLFHTLGVRIIQITYNERNLLGNGCYERVDDGLSKFGIAAVAEMNRLGILVDLSHTGDQTVLDTIEYSKKPVAFTHANARSQFDHPRNKTDEAIRKLAERGGVIGANAFPIFFDRGFEATIDDYLNTIDYLVQMVGPAHVAVGTDFCQDQPRRFFEWLFATQGTIPASSVVKTPNPYHHLVGFDNPQDMVHLAKGLISRGYLERDVKAILGGNWLRLFSEVWRS